MIASLASADAMNPPTSWRDPVSRCFHIAYDVPKDASDRITILCAFSPHGKDEWQPASVTPLVSETALNLCSSDKWQQWTAGRVIELRAAGLRRTIVFNPYPEAQQNGRVDVDFRIRILEANDKQLNEQSIRLEADNSDVVYLRDWSKIIQQDDVMAKRKAGRHKWRIAPNGSIHADAGEQPLPQLTYPLDLRGSYAIYISTPADQERVGVRLTGDERTDRFGACRPHEEKLWRLCKLDRQHLIIKQLNGYNSSPSAGIGYVKLVPLSNAQVIALSAAAGKRDKTVIAYFEPYSWAFMDNIQETIQHREPLTAYKEANVDIVDAQLGRFGMKMVYESRRTDQLLHSTVGDPINGVVPSTDNVGRMQQYTNTLDAELRYSRELGLKAFANFGASACYIDSPLQGDITKQHPDWLRGSALRFELPPVRSYVLSLCEEALQAGAPGISIDFCRYPECIDKSDTCTTFLRELRALADRYGNARKHIRVLVRFPATGVRLCDCFDYKTWAKQNLVDYLCPSNIQGRHMSFDIKPYVEAVRGTRCKLTPVVDAIGWGPTMPGPYLWRVKQLYDAGADGIYIYQADDPILGRPADRRTISMLGSTAAVKSFWKHDAELRPHRSKGIYISRSETNGDYGSYERVRVWLEGIRMGQVELYLDGKLINKYDHPPYTLGFEDYSSDNVIPHGQHTLRVRAKDGGGWIEQSFTICGV